MSKKRHIYHSSICYEVIRYLGERGCWRCAKMRAHTEVPSQAQMLNQPCPDFQLDSVYEGTGVETAKSSTVLAPTYWEIKDEAPCKRKATVYLEPSAHFKIKAMTKAMDSSEWIGYLVGKEVKDGYLVEDVLVPEQEVSVASAKPKEVPALSNIVGTVHSHGFSSSNTTPSLSSTDQNYVVGNHPITLVTNGQNYGVAVRLKMPCGYWVKVEAELTLAYPKVEGLDKFVEEAKGKCKKASYTVVKYGQYGQYSLDYDY